MLPLLASALLFGQAAPAAVPAPLAPLAVYEGSWTVDAAQAAGAAAKPDQLTNHCHMVDAFFTCEQVVNGKPAALLVFVAGERPGAFYTQIVLPDGHAAGRGDLTIAGNHWTYLSRNTSGAVTTSYRVENFFRDRDHIHYEQYRSTDGMTWEKTGGGDEVRVTT